MSLTVCIYLILYVCRVFATVDPSPSVLESRIIALENRDQLLMQIIQDQATKIDDLTAIVKFLDDQNTEQGHVIDDIQKELETVKKTVYKPDTKSHLSLPSSQQHDPSSFIPPKRSRHQIVPSTFIHSQRARRYLLNGVDTVAFHANFPDDAHVVHHAIGTPIAFSNVLLNVGGGYNPSTSLFTAPMPGIYIFSASVMSSLKDVGHPVHAGIMKNGKYLAGVYANRDGSNVGEQGSVTITTQLSVGDQVSVQHYVHNDGTIYGGGLTSFMGCLIFAS